MLIGCSAAKDAYSENEKPVQIFEEEKKLPETGRNNTVYKNNGSNEINDFLQEIINNWKLNQEWKRLLKI
jgi:hypothetical protein